MTSTTGKYLVSFHGSASDPRPLPRHRKQHATLAQARAEIARVDQKRSGTARAACPGVVIDPDGKILSGQGE